MATAMPPFRSPLAGGASGGALGSVPEGAVPRRPSATPGAQQACDTVTVALRHGLETVDILRLRRACGSALQGTAGATVSFLVPAGTAEGWRLPGTSCTPGAAVLPPTDPRWLVPPAGANGAPAATDPWILRSVLCEAACTLTAGGLGPF